MGAAIIVGLIVVLLAVVMVWWYRKKNACTSTNCPPPGTCSSGVCTPASRPSAAVVTDCGYPSPRGWYDIQNQGVKNDYCRNVGGGGPPIWFSCALAGSTNQYTPQTQVIDPSLPNDPLAPGDICYVTPPSS